MKAWHFTADKLRDGRPVPAVGEKLVHEGTVELCSSGLHASADPYDALVYAPGPILHRVELSGTVETGADKLAASERTILASADATATLQEFARWCALQVIDLWDAPAVVREFLETGSPSLAQDAARAAYAAYAAYAAADAAADAAAHAAYAAHTAADAASYAARTAASHAARAASHAARAAAYAADATPYAAYTAACTAADAAHGAQRAKFNELVNQLFNSEG